MKKLLNKIQTGILLLLAAGTPAVAVLDEKFWFEKRVALAASAVVLLALLAIRVWTEGFKGFKGYKNDVGWGLLGVALFVAAAAPAGRIANLMAPELWVGVGAVLAYFAIKSTTTSSRQVKLGFFGVLGGLVVTAALVVAGLVPAPAIGRPQGSQLQEALQLLQRSPIWGEFREFRVARLGILQIASGLGILGMLGTLALVCQLVLKSVKEVFKSSSIWWKVLNLLVLVLLAGFLLLPHPTLMLWPLAVTASIACGITEGYKRDKGFKGTVERVGWAVFVGALVVIIIGSSYGLGRVVWGEIKFREALAAANRNEGIATYYALLESIKRNPYEVRYHLLASQIDIALANSIAAAAGERGEQGEPGEATPAPDAEGVGAGQAPSARMTAQDRNNILILIQQAVVEGKQAIKLDPENSFLWQNLASIYRALIGVAGGAEDWALKSYQRAAELNPKDPNPQLFIGEIHFLAGNFQGAVDGFQEATRIDPNFARAHYNLAVVYNALNEIDKAIEELRETLALLPADDPGREQVEKDLSFLKGDLGEQEEPGKIEIEETAETEELKEATTSAEVQPPPPPVGPEESTESAEPKPIEVVP